MKRIYLALFLAVAIAACNAPDQTSDSERDAAAPSETQASTDPQEAEAPTASSTTTETSGDETPVEDQTTAAETASEGTSSEQNAAEKGAAASPSQVGAKPSKTSEDKASEKVVTKPSTSKEKEAANEIAIDETVCGAGGQDAYFETRKQEIYICRSENQTLTYIATPKKKKGNSVFLPAVAIQDGDKTAYLAEDGDRRFLVGPVGYRLEENGKAIAQERVIRSR